MGWLLNKDKDKHIDAKYDPAPAAGIPANPTSEHKVYEPGSLPPIPVPAMPQPAQSNDLTPEKLDQFQVQLDQFQVQLNQFIDVAKADLRQEAREHHNENVKILHHQEVQIQGKLDHSQEQLNQFIERAKCDLSESTSNFTKDIKTNLAFELQNYKTSLKNKLNEGFTKLSDAHLKKLEEPIRIYTEEKKKCEEWAEKIEADRNALTQREKLLSQQFADYDTKKSTLDDQERKLIKAEEQVREAQQGIAKREEKAESSENSAKLEVEKAKKIKDNADVVRKESLKISDEFIPDFLAKTSLMMTQVLVPKEDEDETRNMLLSQLHLLSRTFRFAEEDGSCLKKNLSETGRFLFRFLKQRDLTSEDATDWKDIINGKLTDQESVDVELRIPEIGEPYKQQWMQISGSSKGDRVEQVVNWGVMTREGIRVHKAEVEV